MDQDFKKRKAAERAYEIIEKKLSKETVLGIGTGSTTNYFIDILNNENIDIYGIVSSSKESTRRLEKSGLKVLHLNDVYHLDFYVDGADEFNDRNELIKGGGGALTREKILASSSKCFICIVDDAKFSKVLGNFPVAIEVIELARSAISRQIMKLGGKPVYREDFLTDNGNQIIDVQNLDLKVPIEVEQQINSIPGVVENGIFSKRKADIILKSSELGVENIDLI
tara:strand:- start:676 stop:1350 length:675 start_codon:yes stop_codon:yes gene_type:complete